MSTDVVADGREEYIRGGEGNIMRGSGYIR